MCASLTEHGRAATQPSALSGNIAIASALHTIQRRPVLTPQQPNQGTEVHIDANQLTQQWIKEIKDKFTSLDLGHITVSAYDTAWVAMVPSLHDPNSPQFPQCLDWIIQNQLSDGSWGDEDVFLAYERVCNTIACLVALKTWDRENNTFLKGIEYICKNLERIQYEAIEYMPTAFEIIFPGLLEDAKLLGIDLPYDLPIVHNLAIERQKKLQRIPMEILHSQPTTLLHSLEGLHRVVNWERMLKLQAKNGSFLFSPASTACALRYTKDTRCLDYLNFVLQKYKDAVPSVYPVDLFERMWMVDRLERLGISRHFHEEIHNVLQYVYRNWTKDGLAWAKESNVFDVDDTAMGFLLLRNHGFIVSPDVFKQFRSGNEFFCFKGQTSQAITGLHNLHRASQLLFPNENILENSYNFTRSFLVEKQKEENLHDKWVISKSIKAEVEYSLSHPWIQSLPRIETRNFIENYGVKDAWIAKSLYKMKFINNETYVNLAKVDYNYCQFLLQKEMAHILKWNEKCGFDKLIFARQNPIGCFFSIAATLFEPEYMHARITWAKMSILITLIDDLYDVHGSLHDLAKFTSMIERWDLESIDLLSKDMKIIFLGLHNTINSIKNEALNHQGHDFSFYIKKLMRKVVHSMHKEAKWRHLNHFPDIEEYMDNAKVSIALETIIQPTSLFLGENVLEEEFETDAYLSMMCPLSTISRINNDIQGYKREKSQGKVSCVSIFLKENPSSSDLEAINHFKHIRDQLTKVLVKECLTNSSVSRKKRMLHLNFAKIINYFYSKGDGHTSIKYMYEDVKKTMYMPIP
uniref:Ent-isopimara 8,15 diene synthase n=1 Tax=Vittaria appalachiana TaxID=57323 RepID=A0A8U0D888_9MONI|nr:ent-isopimara 8,15 diene synthase [Vittaria appalachiana]